MGVDETLNGPEIGFTQRHRVSEKKRERKLAREWINEIRREGDLA
jgi:hypothetical protein